MSSIQTIARSELPQENPMRAAVRTVFQAAKADFGAKFQRQFDRRDDATALTENAWCWRLYNRTKDIRPECVIDGYERAVRESAPNMPSLSEIAMAARSEHTRTLADEQEIAWAAAPKVSGLAGYVDHLQAANPDNTVALGCIETMREILARPDPEDAEEQTQRLDKAMRVHAKVMPTAPPVHHRGNPKRCPVPGCEKRGAIAKTTHADGDSTPYFCAEHFRNG